MAHRYVIRKATENDCEAIHSLIMELAVFEKAPEQVYNTVEGNLLRWPYCLKGSRTSLQVLSCDKICLDFAKKLYTSTEFRKWLPKLRSEATGHTLRYAQKWLRQSHVQTGIFKAHLIHDSLCNNALKFKIWFQIAVESM